MHESGISMLIDGARLKPDRLEIAATTVYCVLYGYDSNDYMLPARCTTHERISRRGYCCTRIIRMTLYRYNYRYICNLRIPALILVTV